MLRIKKSQINGHVKISGAKNSMQFLVTAALLSNSSTILHRVPQIQDVYTLKQILYELNCDVKFNEASECMEIINRDKLNNWILPPPARKLRSCLLFLPGLLHQFGMALVPFPGGDPIGERPLDTHFYVLNKFGCEVEKKTDGYLVTTKNIKASKLYLPYPSFTGTGLALMMAAKTKGTSIIFNGAKEPELIDLEGMLNLMGAKIEGVGTNKIIVHGTPNLNGAEFKIMPDRLEVGTFLIIAAITSGEISIDLDEIRNSELLLDLLQKAGCDYETRDGKFYFSRKNKLLAQNIVTGPHPAFSTDLQPQFMTLMTQAVGKSNIVEKMHSDRFLQVPYLKKMGAEISLSKANASVIGPKRLVGTKVEAKDIRGGMSLLIAGLVADTETQISGSYHLERGYSNLYEKLRKLGATVIKEECSDI